MGVEKGLRAAGALDKGGSALHRALKLDFRVFSPSCRHSDRDVREISDQRSPVSATADRQPALERPYPQPSQNPHVTAPALGRFPHILNRLWITRIFALQKGFSEDAPRGRGADRHLLYSTPAMDSFLDRLLADQTPLGVRQPETPGDDRAATALPLLPSVPAGPAAPRIAVYDTLTSPPRVIPIEADDLPALIAALSEKTYHHCREQGGQVPYTVIQELIENLIHAYFQDVVVTILDGGQTIRISDHGPGIDDKERAFQPGFTTATAAQRQIIRGVGSGLPIARESLQFLRGVLSVEDNLGGGAVVTIRLPQHTEPAAPEPAPSHPRLTTRQKKVLVLLMELGAAGPTLVGRELGIAPSTAFRELGLLEEMGLIQSLGDGKRALREEGLRLLDAIL
jgi:hypothetical protein